MTLTGPVTLVQGGTAFIARYPVFLEYPPSSGSISYSGPKTDDTIYDAGGIWNESTLGPLSDAERGARVAYAPFDCGSACYNATHYFCAFCCVPRARALLLLSLSAPRPQPAAPPPEPRAGGS